MPQDAFAGPHTIEKLERLEGYLTAFLTVMKKQNFKTIYFDAFAGTGTIPTSKENLSLDLGDEARAFVTGSAKRALALNLSFDEFVFVEKNPKKARELAALRTEFPDRAKQIQISCSDANTAIQEFCKNENWKNSRAVVFLDPFGNQVEWQAIKSLAHTHAVDLWYLFPAGLGVARQIGNDGTVHFTHEESLNRLYGTTEWESTLIEKRETNPDLFGHIDVQIQKKNDAPIVATEFMIKSMRSVFQGGVLDDFLPLGSKNHHNYSLLFAWANPSPNAKKAGKIAKAVMRSNRYGRRK